MTDLSRAIHSTRVLASKSCVELFPGPLSYFVKVECLVRFFCTTYFHICGTFPMSFDQSNLNIPEENDRPNYLDSSLKVMGVEKLRVADASVFPRKGIPSGPIQATVMAIALYAAECIHKSTSP